MADDKVQQLRAQMHEDAKSGIITLKTPLRAGGRDVTELAYDFGKLTGWEYADAMDMDPRAGQHLQNHAQAGALPVRHGGGQSQRGRGRDGYSRTAGRGRRPDPPRGAGHGFSDHFDTGGKTQFLKRIVDASLATRTPVDTFMGMTLARFYDFAEAIAQVLKEMRSKG